MNLSILIIKFIDILKKKIKSYYYLSYYEMIDNLLDC